MPIETALPTPVANINRWGPCFLDDGSVLFRLWAPAEDKISLQLDGQIHAMAKSADGWFEVSVPALGGGNPYGFLLSDGRLVPDPASRGQLDALGGLSVLPHTEPYLWRNAEWSGRRWEESIFYEVHVGTFTPEGTYRAAMEKLGELAALGITAIELMPVAHFPGTRGWGYDGVLLYAPFPPYGSPEDLKAFIDAAHGHGLMVFLDVVYNHFGPRDNYLPLYAPDFFRRDKATPWGDAIAFERAPVRRYFIDNALQWLGEFRFDGLRLDAVDQIEDTSDVHILKEIGEAVRQAFPDRQVHLAVENPGNTADLLERREGKAILYDGDWNDDFHNAVHVAATGADVGHYARYGGNAWQRVSQALQHGHLFPGVPVLSGSSIKAEDLPPSAFIDFLHNHDQIGNRVFGERLSVLVGDDQFRLWTALLMLTPQIPMMFMGDHYNSRNTFHFFADYDGELAEAIVKGRQAEAPNFGGTPTGRSVSEMLDPIARSTFETCKLDWSEAQTEQGQKWQEFLADLIAIRREAIIPLLAEPSRATILADQDRVIALDWQFASAKLELRANFSDQPLTDVPIAGDLIYESRAYVDGVIPPQSVVVGLA